MKNVRKQRPIMHLKVHTRLVSQSHNLFKDKPDGFHEQGIDERMDNLRVLFPGVLVCHYLVLHKKVRNVVFEIDRFGHRVQADQL